MESATEPLEVSASNSSTSAETDAVPPTLIGSSTRTAKNLICAVCSSVFHNAISITPCLHTFCAGCIYQWFAEKQNCPSCRAPITDLVPNRFIRDCVDDHLNLNKKDKRCVFQTDVLDKAELDYLEKWLVQHDASFLSAMQMSTSGHVCPTKAEESKIYYESLYNEKKRRMDQLRHERHNRLGNRQIAMMPIDEYLDEKKKSADANETKEKIKTSMQAAWTQISADPDGRPAPFRAERAINRIFFHRVDREPPSETNDEARGTIRIRREFMQMMARMEERTENSRVMVAFAGTPYERNTPHVQPNPPREGAVPQRRSGRIAYRNRDEDVIVLDDQ